MRHSPVSGGRMARQRRWLRGPGAVVAAALLSACAGRTAPLPPVPPTAAHPELLPLNVPVSLRGLPGADRVEFGWRYLQAGDLRAAEHEFTRALGRSPDLYPARTGEGYLALVRADSDRALAAFDAVLMEAPSYVPALVGRGLALLALERGGEAIKAFEAALAVDPTLSDVERRVDVLRFRSLQDVIAAGRAAAEAGRLDEARLAYQEALAASGESAFLHHELGVVERRAGNTARALEHFRRAAALDPSDADSRLQAGQVLEAQGDLEGALDLYRAAAAIEPGAAVEAAIARSAARLRDAQLPPEFGRIAAAPSMTRGDLAALVGIRLQPLLERAPQRQAVVTDVSGHWAQPWIAAVIAAGVMDPYENHTFQPRSAVRRGDLAAVVGRLVGLVAARDPALRARLAQPPQVADVEPGHLSYQAVAVAVGSGVLPLVDGQRFQIGRLVSGAEAVEAIDRVGQLAGR